MQKIKITDVSIIVLCLALSALFFTLDVMFPLGVVEGTMYLSVILLSLWIRKKRHIIYLAVFVSCLAVLGVVESFEGYRIWEAIVNRYLALAVIWVVTIFGLQHKKEQETKAYLASIVDSSSDAIFGKTLEGKITSWNKGAEALYGYSKKEIVGSSVFRLVPEERKEEAVAFLRQLKEGKIITQKETVGRKKSGQSIHVSLTISPLWDSLGRVIGASTIARDITQRVHNAERLKKLTQRLEIEKAKLEQVLTIEEDLNTILNFNKLIDFVIDKVVKVLKAQRCSLMFFDEESRELCIKGYKGLAEEAVTAHGVQKDDSIAQYVVHRGVPVLVKDIEQDRRFAKPNKPQYRTKSFLSVPIKVEDKLIGLINVSDKHSEDGCIFTELDLKICVMMARQMAIAVETSRLYRSLNYLTITDPLTNMYNYRHFAKSLDWEIQKVKRYGGHLCLLIIDVDNFKVYNDTFGHLEGDFLLKEIGRALAEGLRNVDIACRYAGDEFAVILPETKIKDAKTVAEKIRKAVERLSLKKRVSVSIGGSSYAEGMNRYDLILKADMALYEAKKKGKDVVCL